jgi:hypothetical protein
VAPTADKRIERAQWLGGDVLEDEDAGHGGPDAIPPTLPRTTSCTITTRQADIPRCHVIRSYLAGSGSQ